MITIKDIKNQTKNAMEESWALRMMIVDYLKQEGHDWTTEMHRMYTLAQIAHDLQDVINDTVRDY